MPRISSKRLDKLSTNELRQVFGLNLGQWGEMQREISHARHNRNANLAYMLKDGDRILAWALVMMPRGSVSNLFEDETNVYLFTRKSERRKGYASRLLKHAAKKHGLLRVHPHDKVSNAFFDQYYLTEDLKSGRKWLRNGSRKKPVRIQRQSKSA